MVNIKTPSKTQGKIGSSNGGGNALQKGTRKHSGLVETEEKRHESNKIPNAKHAFIMEDSRLHEKAFGIIFTEGS